MRQPCGWRCPRPLRCVRPLQCVRARFPDRLLLRRDAAVQGAALRIFLRVVQRCLRVDSPGCSAAARIGAVVFIHRFGSFLNEHVHFHCCIVDGLLGRLLLA